MDNVILREELPDLIWQITDLLDGRRDPRDKEEKNFVDYNKDNPHVYEDFAKYTFVAIAAGKTEGSAWYIVNRMRWDYYLQAKDANSYFVLSNDYIAFYSRLFMERNREHLDWFDTKLRRVERKIVEELAARVQSRAVAKRDKALPLAA